MNVLMTKKFQPADVEYIRARLEAGIVLVEPEEYNEEKVLEKMPEARVLLGGMLTEKVLRAGSHIELFQIPWTGVDTLNFELIRQLGISCVCNSHSNSSVVAEHAIALYAAAAKKVPYHDAQMRLGNWNRISPGGNEVSPFSRSIYGQKVVFVGYGAVNQSIHSMLSGFNPRVTVVNRSGRVPKAMLEIEAVVTVDQINSAMDTADVVFVAIPLTAETNSIVDSQCFSSMTSSTILVNVARGGVLDEESLYTSLEKGEIYAAGIDTWYNYPKPGESQTFPSNAFKFQKLNNIVMSPHRAGYIDSGFPHLDDAVSNLNNLYTGKPLNHNISSEHGY